MDCTEFYQERDRRTDAYLERNGRKDVPIGIDVGREASKSPAGQLTLLALANQAARIHRRIHFSVEKPEVDLRVSVPFAEKTIGKTLSETCRSIDPCGDFRISSDPPDKEVLSLGVGQGLAGTHNWHVGADRAVARLSKDPLPFVGKNPALLRGAALASCLGAAALLRDSFGKDMTERRLSAWNFEDGEGAEKGPVELPPIDVGRVLMVGAGAVGGALAYWLHAFGVSGNWSIVDPDRVELHNTNRHLLTQAGDAGRLRDGNLDGLPKSELVARYLPGEAEQEWYEDAASPEELHDVVLCLANEQDVRTKIAQRNDPVVLHATTGQSWLSQLHRHVAGHDDCIRCRTHDLKETRHQCSEAEINDTSGQEESRDAALPFLSSASGLMLTSALHRLQAGEMVNSPYNNWDWDFAAVRGMARKRAHECRDECSVWVAPEVRKRMNEPLRWAHLDGGYQREPLEGNTS
jgi:hypothetical protein